MREEATASRGEVVATHSWLHTHDCAFYANETRHYSCSRVMHTNYHYTDGDWLSEEGAVTNDDGRHRPY